MESVSRFADLFSYTREEDWRAQLLKISNDMGFESTLLAIIPAPKAQLEAAVAFLQTNYSPAWRTKYDNEEMEQVDPTVSHCATKSTPLIWSPEIFLQRRQKEVYEEACGYGLRSGVTLPIHGVNGEVGMLCCVSDTRPDENFVSNALHNMATLSLLRDFICETAVQFMTQPAKVEPMVTLTPRELECIKWSAAGKSSWDIAHILNCSEAAVNFHFSNIRRKFNTPSRHQAVVRAIRMGIISAP